MSVSFGSELWLISFGTHIRENADVRFVIHNGGCWILRDGHSDFDDKFHNADKFGEIVVGDNVHIGINAIIMPRRHIGNNSIIGCGAEVTHDIPAFSVCGGGTCTVDRNIGRIRCKSREKGNYDLI